MTKKSPAPKLKTAEKKKTCSAKDAGKPACQTTEPPAEATATELQRLVQALDIQRFELEKQNGELRRAQTEIASSRSKYADLYDFSPVGYFTFDRHGLIREVNHTGAEMLGMEKCSLHAMPFQNFIKPDSLAIFRDHLTAAFRTRTRQTCEINLKGKNGILFPVQLQSIGAASKEGTNDSCHTAVSDISERKRAEEALRKSEERFRVAQEMSLDAFTILDAVRDERGVIVDFRWVYANPKAGQILRRPPEELAGQRLLEILPGNKASSDLFNRYARVVETGEPHDYELPYQSEGIDGWFRNMTVKLGDGITICFTDITERKKADEVRARLAAIVASADDGIIGQDLNGIIQTWNAGAEHIFGYKAEEVIGKPLSLLVPPGHGDEIADILARIKRREQIENFETERRRKDGTIIPVSLKFSAIRDASGKIIGASKIARDISERKRAEETIRQRTEELKKARDAAETDKRLLLAVLDALPIGMAITDIQGGTILANNAFDLIWGGPRPITQSVDDYDAYQAWWADTGKAVAPEEWASAIAVQKGEMVVGQMMRIRRFDGSQAFIINSASPVRDAEGNIVGSAVAIQDITEIKRAEEALRRSEERLRYHVENSPLAVVEWDARLLVTRWAGEAEQIFGWSATETVGKPIMDLRMIFEEDLPIVLQTIEKLTCGIAPHVVTTNRNYRKDGRVITCTWHNTVLQDADGRMESVMSQVLDITERIKAEEALRAAHAKLEQRAYELAAVNRELESFSYTVSHDLKAPLRSIEGFTKALQEEYTGNLDATGRDYLLRVISACRRMNQLIEALLNMARLTRGELHEKTVDLSSLGVCRSLSGYFS
ncbi:MAG: PAS domain S-box protein [Desulfobulbaceae bacterium]|nr:PAS domain S-box protein [Desulfobulbaceae bacterium]